MSETLRPEQPEVGPEIMELNGKVNSLDDGDIHPQPNRKWLYAVLGICFVAGVLAVLFYLTPIRLGLLKNHSAATTAKQNVQTNNSTISDTSAASYNTPLALIARHSSKKNPNEYYLTGVDTSSLAINEFGKIDDGASETPFALYKNSVIYINSKNLLSSYDINIGNVTTIPTPGTQNDINDFVISADTIVFTQGPCFLKQPCTLQEYNLVSKQAKTITQSFGDYFTNSDLEQYSLLDYDIHSDTLEIISRSGDGPGSGIELDSFKLATKDQSVLKSGVGGPCPDDETQSCFDENYSSIQSLPTIDCGRANYRHDKQDFYISTSESSGGATGITYTDAHFVGCLANKPTQIKDDLLSSGHNPLAIYTRQTEYSGSNGYYKYLVSAIDTKTLKSQDIATLNSPYRSLLYKNSIIYINSDGRLAQYNLGDKTTAILDTADPGLTFSQNYDPPDDAEIPQENYIKDFVIGGDKLVFTQGLCDYAPNPCALLVYDLRDKSTTVITTKFNEYEAAGLNEDYSLVDFNPANNILRITTGGGDAGYSDGELHEFNIITKAKKIVLTGSADPCGDQGNPCSPAEIQASQNLDEIGNLTADHCGSATFDYQNGITTTDSESLKFDDGSFIGCME